MLRVEARPQPGLDRVSRVSTYGSTHPVLLVGDAGPVGGRARLHDELRRRRAAHCRDPRPDSRAARAVRHGRFDLVRWVAPRLYRFGLERRTRDVVGDFWEDRSPRRRCWGTWRGCGRRHTDGDKLAVCPRPDGGWLGQRELGAYTSESCACWMKSSTGSGRGTTGHELGVYKVRAIFLPSDFGFLRGLAATARQCSPSGPHISA